jgi:uncharacterized membrane protein YfcA
MGDVEHAWVAAALGLGGFVKGATGMGLPLVSVPALAAYLGVPHTLAILTVPLIVTNGWQVWRYFADRGGPGSWFACCRPARSASRSAHGP